MNIELLRREEKKQRNAVNEVCYGSPRNRKNCRI